MPMTLGCVRLTDWIAKCSSLYTTGMCVLADNQGTIVCTSNLCGDGKVDDVLLQAEGRMQ